MSGLFDPPAPLAARMRPRSLEEMVGQADLLAPGKALGDAIRRGDAGSMILWGPPGSGKTTLGHLIARHTARHFVPFSAVTDGVARVREVVKEAEERRRLGQGTLLFCDEIHRFNKSQQDAFRPHMESGILTLVGATPENPSFALNGALLSRARVWVLAPLAVDQLVDLLRTALADRDRGLGDLELTADDEALRWLAVESDGDARRALTGLEAAAGHGGRGGRLDLDTVRAARAHRPATHDRAGEAHFTLLSAYHKSLRGSDPEGALYWMARLIEGGEDPLVILRRATAMAAEDVGLADPNALLLAVAAREAWRHLGPPEGYLPLTELTIYLAGAPKSNSVVRALHAALDAARATPAAPVPLHLRNAPTALMASLGYGEGYQYPHDCPGGVANQSHLPEGVSPGTVYVPGDRGFERKIAERLAWWRARTTTHPAETGEEPGARIETTDPKGRGIQSES